MENPKNPKIDEIEKDIIEENEDIVIETAEDEEKLISEASEGDKETSEAYEEVADDDDYDDDDDDEDDEDEPRYTKPSKTAVEAIMKKELRLYFSTPTAYVFIASFVCVSAILFTIFNLIYANSSVSLIFSFLPYLFVIMIPILTMRLMAEERALKTDQLLLTAPISVAAIVCGKLFAALYVFGMAIIIMLMYPVILSFYSTVAWGIVLSNYIGFFLMGSAFIAIGIFISSLTENQLVSAIVTIALLLASFLVSYGIKPSGVAIIDAVLSAFSVPKHFDNFFIGIIDIVSVIYYLSITAIFTLLTIYRTEKRRISR